MIVIGDSILAFNQEENAAVADVLATLLARTVFDASQGGARLSAPEIANPEDYREDIRQQYVQHPGNWVWLVMDGGGNDLGSECEVDTCASVLETLVSADGLSGEFPDFVRTVRTDSTRVLVMGYPEELEGETSEFTPLLDLLRELDARQQRMAAALDGVYYASAADAVDATNPAHYADAIHPSVEGSRLIGELLAEAIQAVELEP
ncbi:MAG: SGNH/GDSL hydrolase family protein [Bacteroidota bacterium]